MSAPETFLHYAPGSNFSNGGTTYAPGADGFNLGDTSSQSNADNAPNGMQSLYYIGLDGGTTTAFDSIITATGSDSHIKGYFLYDGVGSGDVSNIKAESDYIHTNAPGKLVFITASNSGSLDSPSYYATPSNTDADYVAANVYPYQLESGVATYDNNAIPNTGTALATSGWSTSQIIPEYQAFGNISDYVTPGTTQLNTEFSQWASIAPTPLFDFAHNWGVQSGDTAISNSTTLQTAFTSHNALTAPSTSLHYAPNGNFANGGFAASGDPGSIGYNVADVSSQSTADGLPSGDTGLLFLSETGDTSGFETVINATASDSKVWGYYLKDDADPSDETALKAEVDYIHANASSKMVFIVADNLGSDTSPSAAFGPSAVDMTTSKDLVGVDPYPVQSGFTGGMNLDIINDRVSAWETAGWSDSQMVPIYQAFGNYGAGDWVMPNQAQEVAILNRWQSLLPSPAIDMTYSWGEQTPSGYSHDTALVDSASLQQVFAAHNA